MIVLWIIVVIVILSLAAGAIFLKLQIKKIKSLEHRLREAFWTRRNKIPLLIELARKGGIKDVPNVIPDLIGNLSSGYLRGNDTEEELIDSCLRRNDMQDLSLLALKKEFEADQEKIKIALNNYNLEKAKFSGLASKSLLFCAPKATE